MMCNNPKLYLVNMNAYIKFGEILSMILSGNRIMTNRMTDGMMDNPNPI